MRGEPTSQAELYAYWFAALENPKASKPHPNDPQPGFYRVKVIKDGPWLPVAIWLHQECEEGQLIEDEVMLCLVDGQEADAEETWSWCCMHPIKQDAYKHRIAEGEWPSELQPPTPKPKPESQQGPVVDLLTNELAF